jgi:putative tricarboxylic transport membrane protein
VLGSIAETSFRRAIMMDGGTVFFTRPLSATMLALAILSFVVPLWSAYRQRQRDHAQASGGPGDAGPGA